MAIITETTFLGVTIPKTVVHGKLIQSRLCTNASCELNCQNCLFELCNREKFDIWMISKRLTEEYEK